MSQPSPYSLLPDTLSATPSQRPAFQLGRSPTPVFDLAGSDEDSLAMSPSRLMNTPSSSFTPTPTPARSDLSAKPSSATPSTEKVLDRLSQMLEKTQSNLSRVGQLPSLKKRDTKSKNPKLTKLSDLSLDNATTSQVDSRRRDLLIYNQVGAVTAMLQSQGTTFSDWPGVVGGVVQLWNVLWRNDDQNIEYDRTKYPSSLKHFFFPLAIVQTGAGLKNSCYLPKKDKSKQISQMVQRLVWLLIRITTVVDGFALVVQFFGTRDVQDLIPGLVAIMNPSKPEELFVLICNFFFFQGGLNDTSVYPLIVILCRLIAQETNPDLLMDDLSLTNHGFSLLFDVAFEFDYPTDCGLSPAHSLLARLMVAVASELSTERIVRSRLRSKFQAAKPSDPTKEMLEVLLNNWPAAWTRLQAFYAAAPFIAAGLFGQWNSESRECKVDCYRISTLPFLLTMTTFPNWKP
ncbi:hypothetical protein DFS34DRAFT_638407 [Phlyctochytrium arcticum]|nr:hypothetical protein DFS34DRAFT_641342 [Phlyctochytrium arcticum]KAI9090008.1 hypothetical protein DFS34DRAFT_638407 [Phlyctochytrium arcticum]